MTEDQLSSIVIGIAIDINKRIGPGLLEKVYHECLYHSIKKRGIEVQKEVPIAAFFDEMRLECGYRADIIVENKLIIEVKSVEEINDLHVAQMLTYLKLANCKLGLLLNFNVKLMTTGIKRVVLNL